MTSTIRTTSTSWTTKELPEERIFRRIIAINLTTNGVPAGIRRSLVTPDVGDALLAQSALAASSRIGPRSGIAVMRFDAGGREMAVFEPN